MPTQPPPPDIQDKKLFFEKFDLMLSMAQLALESDSTRIVTLMADAFVTPALKLSEKESSTESYHGLSHHGQAEEKVRQLQEIDRRQMALLKKTLSGLADRKENGERLLDRTMVLYGSSMGDANIHDNTNLPILLAGGGFRHGQHIAFKRDNNAPLCNLFVSMMQRMGVEADAFASSSGRLDGLGNGVVSRFSRSVRYRPFPVQEDDPLPRRIPCLVLAIFEAAQPRELVHAEQER